MKAAYFLIPASIMMAGSAAAQEAPAPEAGPPAPAQQAPQQTPQQGDQAAPTSADISDEEVSKFALAALVIEQIAGDEAVAQEEKQAAMAGAVQQAGLEPARFNQIAVASQSDAELGQRIQLAAAEHIEAASQNQ